MIRLHFVVEGPTEKTFVKQVLTPHLSERDIFPDVRCIETGRKRNKVYKGGMTHYEKAKHDLLQWMKQDSHPEAYFTTMFDLYRLPETFPGHSTARKVKNIYDRVKKLEIELKQDVSHPQDQFIPYIQVHEFEAILFSQPGKFSYCFPNQTSAIESLTEINNKFESPEHINDDNPPSKRIINWLPGYDKISDGPLLAIEIGIEEIRKQCRHFNEWLSNLERLKAG